MIKKNSIGYIQKNTLHQQIAHLLAKRIINEMHPGDKLPSERDIAQDLDVNRATVREALKKLESLGLIQIRHGEGVFVTDFFNSGNLELFKTIIYINDIIPLPILQDILEMRKIIVPHMAYKAALNCTDTVINKFNAILHNADDIVEKDLQVHQLIAKASKNLLYIFILNFFNQIFRDFGYLYFESEENRKRSEEFHAKLYAACISRDGEKAYTVTQDVLVYTENKIFEYYAKLYSKKRGQHNEALY